MTKAELCKKITDQTGCDMQTVSAIVESLMVSIKGSLEKEENVYLRGFGSFIIIPAHNIPAFKSAKEFTDLVSKLKD